jgi:hypothetical protein
MQQKVEITFPKFLGIHLTCKASKQNFQGGTLQLHFSEKKMVKRCRWPLGSVPEAGQQINFSVFTPQYLFLHS